jgi:hypothetical protein
MVKLLHPPSALGTPLKLCSGRDAESWRGFTPHPPAPSTPTPKPSLPTTLSRFLVASTAPVLELRDEEDSCGGGGDGGGVKPKHNTPTYADLLPPTPLLRPFT